MGYNTTLLILNDAFSELEAHPEDFVQRIKRNMHDGGTFGVGCHANPVQVLRTEHADVTRLYVSHGNLLTELSPYASSLANQELLTQIEGNDFYRKEIVRRTEFAEQTAKAFRKLL